MTMIQIQTDNHGLISVSQENALELTTQAIAGDGHPVDAGWYCTYFDEAAPVGVKHFYLITGDQLTKLIEHDGFPALMLNAESPVKSWILYHIAEAQFMSVATPKTWYMYGLSDDTSLIQLKLMLS
jgi:hypothetical protein